MIVRMVCPRYFCGLQFERILVRSIPPNLLQVLYMQGSSAVWLTLLPVQIKKLALLHAGVLLLRQHLAAVRSLGVP